MNYRTMSVVAVLSALMVISAGCLDENKSQGGWVKLLDSESLQGWKTIGGQGKFYFEDGVIVSETVAKTASTFLCSEKEYGDFILELEFKVDEKSLALLANLMEFELFGIELSAIESYLTLKGADKDG